MSDYPDFYLHVERSPIQPTRYQELVIYNYNNRSVSAGAGDAIYIQMPNDGYYYNIDSVCFSCDTNGLMRCAVSYCNDYGSPTWYVVAVKMLEIDCIIPVSQQGILAITYPGALSLYFKNLSGHTVLWSAYVTAFRYQIA